jgi:hypothetical protein
MQISISLTHCSVLFNVIAILNSVFSLLSILKVNFYFSMKWKLKFVFPCLNTFFTDTTKVKLPYI